MAKKQKTLFQIKLNKIYFGDYKTNSFNIPNNSVDCFISDPPFSIKHGQKMDQYNRDNSNVLPYHEIPIHEYPTFCYEFIKEAKRILKPNGNGYIISGYSNQRHILNALDENNLFLQNEIIWRFQFGVYTKKKWVSSHYDIFFFTKNPKSYYFKKALDYFEDIIEIKKEYWKGKIKTANKLPKELVELLIYTCSKPKDIVVDFFCGSGTIPKVCQYMNRNFIGFEIMRETYDFIIKRLNELDY